MIHARSLRIVLAAIVLAFGLGASHSAVHDLVPPGSSPAVHGLDCDESHAEAHCPVCLGHAPHRNILQVPTTRQPDLAQANLRTLHPPGAQAAVAMRFARPEAARAPPVLR